MAAAANRSEVVKTVSNELSSQLERSAAGKLVANTVNSVNNTTISMPLRTMLRARALP